MSYVIYKLNLGIEVSWKLIFIVLTSYICILIDTKYTCLAYVISLIFLVDYLFVFLKLKDTTFILPYGQLVLLTAGLHIAEGILTIMYGFKGSRSIITYQKDKIAGGYQAYRRWVFPLLLFVINGIYIPIVVIMVYANTTLTTTPKKKAKKIGAAIMLYGIIIGMIGYGSIQNIIGVAYGVIAMPILHQLLFVIDKYWEGKTLLYDYPIRGVRILEINHKAYGKGLTRGDIILNMNQRELNEVEQYYKEIEINDKRIWLEIETLHKEHKCISYTPLQLRSAGIILLPRQ